MKIALGTVQFGMQYGVANNGGRVALADVKDILELAASNGVGTLDTAIAYGDSETVLGRAGVEQWQVVTKLPAVAGDVANITAWVTAHIEASLKRLGIRQLHGVLLHRPEQLLGKDGKEIVYALQHIKALGYTRKIGISAYSPEEIDKLSDVMHLDLVQAPLNILDRRLVVSGCAQRLKDQGTEVHIRSAFLQGLLLMPESSRPEKFQRWSALWTNWHHWLRESSLTALQACLAYAASAQEIDRVVVGVDSLVHLNEILTSSHARSGTLPDFSQLVDADLINPSVWNQL